MSKKLIATGKKAVSARDKSVSSSKYRGVHLQVPLGASRFSSDEIARAIGLAIKRNPDAFAEKA